MKIVRLLLCNSCNSCNSPQFGIVLHVLHVLHSHSNPRNETALEAELLSHLAAFPLWASGVRKWATPAHLYEVRPQKDKRGFDLISDALPFGRLWYLEVDDAIDYAKHYSRSHNAVIRVLRWGLATSSKRTSTRAISKNRNCRFSLRIKLVGVGFSYAFLRIPCGLPAILMWLEDFAMP